MGRRAVCIGAGITGVLTARELLLAGWEVTVLEARHVGSGSSSRTAAGIRQQFSTPETVRGMQYAVGFYRAFQAEVEDGTSPIVQSGYLFLHAEGARWAEAQERAAMQQGCGLPVESSPAPRCATGSPGSTRPCWAAPSAHRRLSAPHLVYNEAPAGCAPSAASRAERAGRRGPSRGEAITAVTTPSGAYEADLFLDCTNAWTGRTAEVLGAAPLPVAPLKRYLWFLARDGSLSEDALAAMPLVVGPTGVYVRPEHRGSLLMGKAADVPPEPTFDDADQDRIDPAFSHTAGADGVAVQAWAEIAEVIPALGEMGGLTATTSGFYGTTPDHNPFLGYDPQRPNLIRLVGFSGHGAMFGPFTAAVARALAERGAPVDDLQLDGHTISLAAFRPGRPLDVAEQMVI
ncbi:MAG: FAD-binding oxidoreductase [Myxococcota bacterium]